MQFFTLSQVATCSAGLVVAGCAAEISAALNRDLRTDTVTVTETAAGQPQTFKILTVTGERRMTYFAPGGRMCPENFPDVGRSTEAKSVLDVPIATAVSTGTVKVDDSFKTALSKTNERTESADIIGRLGAIICVAYLNGAIEPSDYARLVEMLVKGSVDRLKKGHHTVAVTK